MLSNTMLPSIDSVLLLAGSAGLYMLFRFWRNSSNVSLSSGEAKLPKWRKERYPFGLETVILAAQASDNKQLPILLDKWFDTNGDTYAIGRLGSRTIMTRDHRNIKTVLTTQFEKFGVAHDRKAHHALLGTCGIFTQDGEDWSRSRALLRPSFTRSQVADLTILETITQELVNHLQKSAASPVDLLPLFQCLTMDSSTDFLLGKSVGSLKKFIEGDGKHEQFTNAFTVGQKYLSLRFIMAGLYWVISPPAFIMACRTVHRFVGECVNQTLLGRDAEKAYSGSGKYVFLEALASETQSPLVLRDQVLSVLLAGRDTSSALLSWIFFSLANDQRVQMKLRAEIRRTIGRRIPTAEDIRELIYLRWVINEVLRLYPPVPINARQALKRTTLPFGGGEDGNAPVVLEEGERVTYSVFSLHRRRDLYGDDAQEFLPERWEKLAAKSGWIYLPFNGGPRICLGQNMALLQASYVVLRLLQEFETLRCPPIEPSYEVGLIMIPGAGVPVILE